MKNNPLERLSLVDVHAHLEEVEDLSRSLQEAREAGVKGIVAVGMDLESNKRTLQIAGENKGYVFPALGYHPWKINEKEVQENLAFIQDHLHESVALGEVGLDYRVKVKRELQWKVFEQLVSIASACNKPMVIHCRYSHQHAVKIVKERAIKRAVFHWYSGPIGLLNEILAMEEYFISATPALVYSSPHREAIKQAPLGKILLETDTPVNYQGLESRPKDVRISLVEVASLKGLDPVDVSRQTTINASRLFEISFEQFAEY